MSTTSPRSVAEHLGQLPPSAVPVGWRQNTPDHPPPCFFNTKSLSTLAMLCCLCSPAIDSRWWGVREREKRERQKREREMSEKKAMKKSEKERRRRRRKKSKKVSGTMLICYLKGKQCATTIDTSNYQHWQHWQQHTTNSRREVGIRMKKFS